MRIAEARAAADRAEQLEGAIKSLKKARHKLALVKKYCTSGKVWTPTLCLHKDAYYTHRNVEIIIPIPSGYIQQAALNEVAKARRELIALGGDPRDAEEF